jgi:Leucine-rich repeat (LRR) protein
MRPEPDEVVSNFLSFARRSPELLRTGTFPETILAGDLFIIHIAETGEAFEEIFKLTWLKKLYLTSKNLERLPDGFFKSFRDLEILDLDDNKLREVRFTEHLANLKELHVRNNMLTSISISANIFPNLQELYLHGNQLEIFPDSLRELANSLLVLDLSNNKITELPAFFQFFIQLRELYLNNNQLKIIPAFLKGLTNLKTLNVSNNPLTPYHSSRSRCLLF